MPNTKKKCVACEKEIIDILPIRSKKQKVRTRYFHYLLLKWKKTIWIHKRSGNDIWENLNEPYLIEADQVLDSSSLASQTQFKQLKLSFNNIEYNGYLKQRLTHQLIESHFFTLELLKKPNIIDFQGDWLNAETLKKAAFPKTLVSFLENNLYF